MAKAFAITLGILLIFAAVIVYRTGYFKEVKISSGTQGPFILAYKVHRGPYHKIVAVIEDVEELFKKMNLPCPLAFGRYLHDPNTLEHDRLESHGGCALTNITHATKEKLEQEGLTLETLPKKEYVVASFDGSPSMGPFRVYPEVQSWLNKYGYQKEGPVLEIYQTLGEDAVLTRYLFGYK